MFRVQQTERNESYLQGTLCWTHLIPININNDKGVGKDWIVNSVDWIIVYYYFAWRLRLALFSSFTLLPLLLLLLPLLLLPLLLLLLPSKSVLIRMPACYHTPVHLCFPCTSTTIPRRPSCLLHCFVDIQLAHYYDHSMLSCMLITSYYSFVICIVLFCLSVCLSVCLSLSLSLSLSHTHTFHYSPNLFHALCPSVC